MKTVTYYRPWLNIVAVILLLPAAYVIIISLLKYGLGIDGPFDSSAPLLEQMGIKESLGWNINLLILLGPVAALLIALWQLLHIKWQFSKEYFRFDIMVRRKSIAMTIAILAILVLASLSIYLAGENCNC